MFKILKYSFFDLMRSRWTYLYCGFYLLLAGSLLWLSSDLSKVIISLMNVVLVLAPLIATMFGVMYYYNSREFTELLLAQPVRRGHIFLGQYLGLAGSLAASLLLGLGLPFALYGIFASAEIWNFFTLLLTGIFLSFIFSALAFLIALRHENRIKGFGLAILMWLFFALIYDGLFLLLLSVFSDYPLEGMAIGLSMFNPIDLSRILILLELDISALMGYTGAVFQKFLGAGPGMSIAIAVLLAWIALPVCGIRSLAARKDF
ncbi:MAG: ABC transporter permease [Saprospiraceae bacterium]|nr:ABC transporter permease [Saprospiraceae bacterium]MCB0682834.1 ABC transporter permease [Saprospiraceae bacterium]